MLAGPGLSPIALQSGIASLKTFVSGSPLLQARTTPRAIGDLAFSDSKANPASLSGMKGRDVLLNVWAAWCPPCREEMPSLDRLKPILERDSDIAVLALSVVVAGFEQLQAFYDSNGLKNLALYRGGEQTVMSTLVISGLPTTLLLDHQGHEVARPIGPAGWDAPDVVARPKATHGLH